MEVEAAGVEAWENGSEHPTLPQAKTPAKQYRVPFAFFYYRTFGNWGVGEMSRELRWFLRDIEDRRDTMIALYREAEIEPIPFTLNISADTAEDVFAAQIRSFLSLTNQVQIKLRKPEAALSYCISKLEEQDFLIFQAAKIQPEEMRGLSTAYESFPIISLNRKDVPSAKLFTLFHELVHILSRTSGICNDMSQDKAQISQIELFCNKIAGLALVPTTQLKQNKNISLIRQYGFDDIYVNALARDFAVSKEVVLHRLWDIGIIERITYY